MACTTGEMMRAAAKTLARCCEALAAVAPVEVIVLPGNHDEVLSGALAVALEMYFEGHERIDVLWGDEPRRYVRFGRTLV
jgi:DNA repair exonuclease SbcCD nuclease subunit